MTFLKHPPPRSAASETKTLAEIQKRGNFLYLKNRKLNKKFRQEGDLSLKSCLFPLFGTMAYPLSKITLNTSQISILLAIIELLFPIIVIFSFTKMKLFVPIEEFPTFHSQELKLSQAPCVYGNKTILNFGYAPQNEFYEKLMDSVAEEFEKEFSAYKNEKELNKWIKSQVEPVAGIIFEKVR